MKTYPIMLELAGRRVVVVGGGAVALRKVQMLKDAGADVVLVAKEIGKDADLADVEVIRRQYGADVLAGAMLVFACTDDGAVNAQIADDARRAGAIVNCVDQPADCDFFVPAIVSAGPVVVAIGTGGASPALAGSLKKAIRNALPEQVGPFAEALSQMRQIVKDSICSLEHRGEILKKLSSDECYQAFCEGGRQRLEEILDDLLGR